MKPKYLILFAALIVLAAIRFSAFVRLAAPERSPANGGILQGGVREDPASGAATEVRLLSPAEAVRKTIDVGELQAYVGALEAATLRAIGDSTRKFRLSVQVTLTHDRPPVFEKDLEGGLDPAGMKALDAALGMVPAPRTASEPVTVQLLFQVRGEGARPKQTPGQRGPEAT